MSLTEDLQAYKDSELKRLNAELNFMGKINNSVDDVLDPIAKDLYDAASTVLDNKTTLAEDHNVAKSIIQSALDKAVDPSVQTVMSDSVNRNLGDTVGMTLGDQSSADMISTVANLATSPNDTGLTTTPQGGFSSASEISSDLYDTSKKMQQKVLNVVAVAITNSPGIIPEFAMTSIMNFESAGTDLVAALARHSELVASLQANTAALDVTYYATDVFERAQNTKTILQTTDSDLLSVRRDVISVPSIFHKDLYDRIRDDDVLAAVNALVDYGNTGNKVVEIRGGLTALDYLMVQIVRLYDDFYRRLENLVDFFGKFSTNMKFNGSMFAHVNQAQAEVRSIMRSIDAAIEKNNPSTMPAMERLWYLELLAIYQKMYLSPTTITEYFNTDPDGYIAAYVPISAQLQTDFSGFAADLSQLQSLTTQYKYWVQKKLADSWPNNPAIQPAIDGLSTTMQSLNATNISATNTTTGHATAYSVPASDTPQNIFSMLASTGMDRASSLLEKGQWSDFFSVTPDSASTRGSLVASLNQEIASIVSTSTSAAETANPSITFSSLQAISAAQQKIQNQKRADDLLSSVLSKFKGDGKQDVVDEIKDVNNTCAAVERTQAGGTP